MKQANKKYRKWIWLTALLAGLAGELALIALFCVTVWRGNSQIPLWQAFVFMAIAIWIYIAYLKQRADDISRFVVDEKVKTHLLVQNLREGIILLDPENRILLLNHRASEVTGFDEIACLGQNFTDKMDECIATLLKSGQDGECNGRVFQTDRDIHVSTIILHSSKTEETHKLVYVQEPAQDQISDIPPAVSKETEHVVNRLRRLSDELLSSRNTISAAWVLLQSLAAQFELNLLTMAGRVGQDSLALDNKTECSVKELLNNIVSNLIVPAKANGIKMEVEDSDDLLLIAADQELLSKALEQVVYNAVLGNDSGASKVIIRASSLGNGMGIFIGDNGTPVGSDSLSELFDCPYHGLMSPNGTLVRGNAVGLGLARTIVEAHGGTLVAESPPEGGLLVTMMLPGIGQE